MSLKPEYTHTSNAHQQQARADLLADVARMGATYEVLQVLAKLSDQELADMCFFFAVLTSKACTHVRVKPAQTVGVMSCLDCGAVLRPRRA